MDDLETRFLGPDDWRLWRLVRLQALEESPDAFGSTYAWEADFDEADWREGLSKDEPRVVVLERDEPVAIGGGFLPPRAGRLHVIAMWTDPRARGRRLAARVLDALVEWAAPRELTLELDVAVGNDAARRAYEAFGFTSTGARRPLREGSPVLVEEMVLRRG